MRAKSKLFPSIPIPENLEDNNMVSFIFFPSIGSYNINKLVTVQVGALSKAQK